MKDPNYKTLKTIRTVLLFMAAVLMLYVLKVTQTIVLPVVIAGFIFIFINPIIERLSRLKCPHVLIVILIMLIVVVAFFGIIYLVFTMVNTLAGKLPFYVSRVANIDKVLSGHIAQLLDDIPDDFSILQTLNIDWYGIAMSWLTSISSKIMSIFSDALMIFIIMLFLLLERQTIGPKLLHALPREKSQKFASLFGKMNKQISRYMLTKTLISLATGVLFYLTAVVTGLDFALVWGVLAFILNFIPTFGSIIVTVLTILMAIIQFFPVWSPVIYVAVLTVATEMVLGNIIDPRLQGVQLNISPVVILISLSLWGYIWGIVGMFLAVPLTSVIHIVCAMIPSLRPISVMLSSGQSYLREFKEEEAMKKKLRKKRRNGDNTEDDSHIRTNDDDIVLPDAKKD